MAEKLFWRITKVTFFGCFHGSIFLFLFTFVILPQLMVLPARRSHLKGKMRRKMMRQGMPRNLANESAEVYIAFLRDFSSIRGIKNTVNQFRKIEEKDEELSTSVIVENNNTIPAI
ncbi:MAG: hypothetical protein ACTSPT_08770 [Candidatus Heimdallarchaeota archaeon]